MTDETIEIPLNCLAPSLRRHSGVDHLDITGHSDFLVTQVFPDMNLFLADKKTRERFESNVVTWREYVKRRMGNVLLTRKFDLSAPGTSLFSFHSSVSLVPGEFWVIRPLSSDFAKILSMWFNSTPNLAQMFLSRTETRGTWMKIDVRTLKESYIIDPRTLSSNEDAELSKTFREIANISFPSITKQLETKFPARKTLDTAVLRTIGFSEKETEEILDSLYPALAKEIEQLKTMMQG